MKIMYWSDYACPYCYIGETHLKKAIENLNLGDQMDIEMLAFELDPSASKTYIGATVDRFAKKYGLSFAGAQERIDGISQMGREAGLDFRYAETRYTSTFDAHRLTKLAGEEGPETADALAEELFRAGFCRGEELADNEVLLRCTRAAGLDEDRVHQVLASDEYAEAVRADERAAHSAGVSGVPFFVFNGQYAIPGALGKTEMMRVLQKIRNGETS